MKRTTVVVLSSIIPSAAALACPPTDCDHPYPRPQPAILLSAVQEVAPAEHGAIKQPLVELAICLDTSGSMDGLIESAKIKLWDIVNDLALAKPTPKLRVALLTFGNDGHNPENGWVNIDAAFTEDLDMISQKLFALRTNGGTELVGRVLKAAGEQLDWSAANETLKLIVVAGNESAEQDTQYSFRDVCKSTIARGIMINSIYCGNAADTLAPAWKEVSMLADGKFASIDQNNGTVVIATPFDDELATLSGALNTTYIAYGMRGDDGAANQEAQDINAAGLGKAVAAQRCATKGQSLYDNRAWDLVDACRQAEFKLDDLKEEELPENMRTMTAEQRRAYVSENDKKRAEIQAKVSQLAQQRQAYVEQEMKKAAGAAGKSFDAAIRAAIREQATSKGMTFEQPKKDDGC